MEKSREIGIGFSIPGVLEIEVPKEVNMDSQEQMVAWARAALNEASDAEIFEAIASTSDFSIDDFLDETPEVEEITDDIGNVLDCRSHGSD